MYINSSPIGYMLPLTLTSILFVSVFILNIESGGISIFPFKTSPATILVLGPKTGSLCRYNAIEEKSE